MRFCRRVGVLLAAPIVAQASAQLVMYTAADCAACLAFEREVGDRYPRSDVASVLPLKRRPYDPEDALPASGSAPVRGTPTFVAVCDGREIDRIVGYQSDELFWMRVEAIIQRLPPDCR
ncbi:thioredoxin family protein [Sinimarinibacterium thermocellulolyticum]|uniref:Thioredoxin family protein n=1 Tax=Sinimarinibacterium thermocellulolyticum TaxID=3170016 RepID=A0ABV2ADK1_9GAMM